MVRAFGGQGYVNSDTFVTQSYSDLCLAEQGESLPPKVKAPSAIEVKRPSQGFAEAPPGSRMRDLSWHAPLSLRGIEPSTAGSDGTLALADPANSRG